MYSNTTDMYTRGFWYLYWQAFYHAILLLGGNEIGPRDELEYIFCSSSLILGAMVNANVFGNIAVIMQEMNKKASRFQEKIDTANTAMMNMGLPMSTQNKVINYLLYTQANLDKQREFIEMKSMISPSLNMDVVRSIFSYVILNNPIFGGGNDNLVDHVLQSIGTGSFLPEDSIIKQGNDPEILYFLSEGE